MHAATFVKINRIAIVNGVCFSIIADKDGSSLTPTILTRVILRAPITVHITKTTIGPG